MQSFINWLIAHKVELLTFLFILSEALAVIPGVKANSVFQAIASAIKWLKEKFVPAQA